MFTPPGNAPERSQASASHIKHAAPDDFYFASYPQYARLRKNSPLLWTEYYDGNSG